MVTRLFSNSSIYDNNLVIIRGDLAPGTTYDTSSALIGAIYITSQGAIWKKEVDGDTSSAWVSYPEFKYKTQGGFYTISSEQYATTGLASLVIETPPVKYVQKTLVPVIKPKFTLTHNYLNTGIDEGTELCVLVTTEHVKNETILNYFLSGTNISPSDAQGLSGTTTVYNGLATIRHTIMNDLTTEGAENLRITLSTGEFVEFVINDTSIPYTDEITYSPAPFINIYSVIAIHIRGSAPYSTIAIKNPNDPINGWDLTSGYTDAQGDLTLYVYWTSQNEIPVNFPVLFYYNYRTILVPVIAVPMPVTYTLTNTSEPDAILESGSVGFLISTTGIPGNLSMPYTISGVTSLDLSGAPLFGTVTTDADGNRYLNYIIAQDFVDVTDKVMVLTVDAGEGGLLTSTLAITNNPPTYDLRTNRGSNTVLEGSQIIIILDTTAIPNNYKVPYTISGISSSELSGVSLTGNFNIANNSSTLYINVASDAISNNDRSFTLSLITGESIIVNIQSISKTYALSTDVENNICDDFTEVKFELRTTNVSNNTIVNYTISGVTSDEIDGEPLESAFNIYSNYASKYLYLNTGSQIGETRTLILTLGTGESLSLTITGTVPV